VEDLREDGIEFGAKRRRVDACTRGCETLLDRVRFEEFEDEGPHPADGGFGAPTGFLGSAGEGHQPAGGVVTVVGDLVDALDATAARTGSREDRRW